MIYEARPNVTIDALTLGWKAGNALILRGGSAAEHSNQVLVNIAQQALRAAPTSFSSSPTLGRRT